MARSECEALLDALADDVDATQRNYQVIYADPPWRYTNRGVQGALRYATMSTSEICALPVARLAGKECVLFLWTTGPMLADAIDVIRAWKFGFRTVFKVWKKTYEDGRPRVSPGFWSRPCFEYMLVAVRGSVLTKWRTTFSEPQLHAEDFVGEEEFQSVIGPHSKKPDAIRDSIYNFLNVERRIELFARSLHPGWDAWGLEVPGYLHRDLSPIVRPPIEPRRSAPDEVPARRRAVRKASRKKSGPEADQ